MKTYFCFLLFLFFGLLACENSDTKEGLITSGVDCIVPEGAIVKLDSVMESKVTVTPIVQLR